MVTRTIIENVKDALAAASMIVESTKSELIWLLPAQVLAFADQFGLTNQSKVLIEKGVRVRGLTKISETSLEVVREYLNIGEEVRHIDEFQGAFMLVADKKESISSMNVTVQDLSLDDPIVAFWTDDQTYADFLVSTFEAAWNEAVDVEKRAQELSEQGPQHA